MQQKTMGSFIAALRKANGFTQKDLAEKLNVSDKTVSRWERDDGTPELALIPVISEIFNITSDELLRGERASPAQALTQTENRKTEKQCARILALGLSRFKSLGLIALGLAICGFIAAMVCNMAFMRAYLGFFIGSAFYVAAFIAQLIFINQAFLAVSDTDLSIEQTGVYKHSVIVFAEKIIVLILALFTTSLPLLLVNDAYAGLSAEYLIPSALLFGGITLAVCGIAVHFINYHLYNKGTFALFEKQTEAYICNYKLRQKIGGVLIALLAFTALFNFVFAAGDTTSFAQGTVFNDYETFKEYMAQDIEPEMAFPNDKAAPAPTESIEDEYRDEQGNIITREQAHTRQITNANGEEVCEYVWLNKTVISVSYGDVNSDMLPIKTVTSAQLLKAQNKIAQIHAVFLIIYTLEIITAVIFYFLKRKKV